MSMLSTSKKSMLYNSSLFIFVYLPVVILGFFWIGRIRHSFAACWLALASLVFYGNWNPTYVLLLLGSILFNYCFSIWIANEDALHSNSRKKHLLIFAISFNLLVLGYFKYFNFFLTAINNAAGTHYFLEQIVLPLGISFYTFTQIAFLVDTSQGKVKEYSFVHYILFVTYFPHLIAGPVLHHKEMMPQFARASTYRFSYESIAVGLTIFFIGLFKKVVLADNIGSYVSPIFGASTGDIHLTFIEAWGGALGYTLQLYFDFSGYSDMAIGLSRMFGVNLPLNFHSPYKSVNIIEFWRRWHMTLSRFLRDYLYFPLGGNRLGNARRYVNLMTTMLLGGLWHGAGWTFVIWGGLHGVYLSINHGWHALRKYCGQDPSAPLSKPMHALATMTTFLAIVIAWVIFRAENLDSAIAIFRAMLGMNGFALPSSWLQMWGRVGQILATHGVPFGSTNNLFMGNAINWVVVSLLIVWCTPNTQQIMAIYQPAIYTPKSYLESAISWKPNIYWTLIAILIGAAGILSSSRVSEFIYFNF